MNEICIYKKVYRSNYEKVLERAISDERTFELYGWPTAKTRLRAVERRSARSAGELMLLEEKGEFWPGCSRIPCFVRGRGSVRGGPARSASMPESPSADWKLPVTRAGWEMSLALLINYVSLARQVPSTPDLFFLFLRIYYAASKGRIKKKLCGIAIVCVMDINTDSGS